jgi:hypothetical protein
MPAFFLSRSPDSIVKIDEPNFYSWWQEESWRMTASADTVGHDSKEVREITIPLAMTAQT